MGKHGGYRPLQPKPLDEWVKTGRHSKYRWKGVYRNKCRWQASIRRYGRKHYLGSFKTEEQAAAAARAFIAANYPLTD